jgi:hypothetical protein
MENLLGPNPPLKKEDWVFRTIRPANYPYRRLARLVDLIVRHRRESIFADYVRTDQKILTTSKQKEPEKNFKLFQRFILSGRR